MPSTRDIEMQSVSVLEQAGITTSEQLVKTLLTPQPKLNKVSIAAQAWKQGDLFVPKKAELISRWTLEHLCSSLKGTSNSTSSQRNNVTGSSTPELELEAWQLLRNVVESQISTSTITEAARRTWLSNLASTQPVLQLAIAVANHLSQSSKLTATANSSAVLEISTNTLKYLLPPSSSRIAATNVESVTDAIVSWLSFLSTSRSSVERACAHTVLQAIVPSWSTALQYGSNAKRNHHHFIVNSVPPFLRAFYELRRTQNQPLSSTSSSSEHDHALLGLVEQIGSLSLFTNEALRAILQTSQNSPATDATRGSRTKSSPAGIIAKLAIFLDPKGDSDLIVAALHTLPRLCTLLHDKLTRCEALSTITSSISSSSGPRETQQMLVRKSMLSEFLVPISACIDGLSKQGPVQTSQLAEARKGLLKCIEQDNLYVAGSQEHDEWRSLFDTFFKVTHKGLQAAVLTQESVKESSPVLYQFDSLTSLWRLEKGVVEDHLISVFALAALLPVAKSGLEMAEQFGSGTKAALEFFRSVAEIHGRFRTVPSLLSILLRSMVEAADSIQQVKHLDLQRCLFGSQTFLSELSKICRNSLMPVQVADTIRLLVSDTQNVSTIGEVLKERSPQKKTRQSRTLFAKNLDKGAPSAASALPAGALTLASQLQLVAQILQSVTVAPTLRVDCLQAAQMLHDKLLIPALDLVVDHDRTNGYGWGVYSVAAAALHARESLLSDKWRYNSSEPVRLDGCLPTESLPCLEAEFDRRADALVELIGIRDAGSENCSFLQFQFMAVQSILQRADRDLLVGRAKASRYCQQIENDKSLMSNLAIDMITMLRSQTTGNDHTDVYTGMLVDIRSHRTLYQALWTVLVTRWAGLLERLASQKTLTNLAHILVLTATLFPREDCMRFVSTSALRDASFLELSQWRIHILDCVQSELDNSSLDVVRRLGVATPLEIVPMAWITKAHLSPLFNSLLKLDQHMLTIAESNPPYLLWEHLRSLIGRFLNDSSSSLAFLYKDLIKALLSLVPPYYLYKGDDRLRLFHLVSLTTFEAGVNLLHTRASKSPDARSALATVLSTLEDTEQGHLMHNSAEINLRMSALQSVYDILDGDVTLLSRPPPDASSQVAFVRESLDRIDEAISQATTNGDFVFEQCIYHLREVQLRVVMVQKSAESVPGDLAIKLTELLSPLCSMLKTVDHPEHTSHGTELILAYIRAVHSCGAGDRQGHQDPENEQASHLAATRVCLAHAAFNASTPADVKLDKKRISLAVAQIIEQLSPESYDQLLGSLLPLLTITESSIGVGDKDRAALVATIGLLLCNGPPQTSKIAKTHLSSFLGLLVVNAARSSDGVEVQLSYIDAMETVCSSKAMLLRSQDVAMMLQMFGSIFAPCMTDESLAQSSTASYASQAKTALFMGVVACLGSVIRLRQDLMLTLLPQLAALLSRMCALFRRTRTASVQQGSGLYNRQLRRDLPTWLDPLTVEPLQASPEARAFSRLLAGLTVKNIALGSGSEASKAKSLASPFSKHATHVLVAYMRALTSANTTVPADVRIELEPGMLTLCSIIGYHQRDSAMVSMLDAAGKMLLKQLWKTYEAQRYKGG